MRTNPSKTDRADGLDYSLPELRNRGQYDSVEQDTDKENGDVTGTAPHGSGGKKEVDGIVYDLALLTKWADANNMGIIRPPKNSADSKPHGWIMIVDSEDAEAGCFFQLKYQAGIEPK